MCGIVGVAGLVTTKEEKIFKNLLIMDSIRGEDSTGIAAVNVQGNVTVVKQVGNPFELMGMQKFKEIFARLSTCLIGHNRWATTGAVKKANAHPFEFDSLVGVHNGTLKNKWKLEDGNKYDTDSEALYYNIDKNGLKPTIEMVEGAYTLVWYDKNDESINFLRNEERPLSFALSEDGKALFWASEGMMLAYACAREGYKLREIQQLPIDQHYKFFLPDGDNAFDKAKVRAVEQKTLISNVSAFRGNNTQNHQSSHNKAKTDDEDKLSKLDPKWVGKMIKVTANYISRTTEGANYIKCTCADFNTDIRLFIQDIKAATELMETKYFQAQVSSRCIDKFFSTTYYKLSPNTVIKGWVIAGDVKKLEVTQEEEEPIDPIVKDHLGREIDKKEFDKRYTVCAWCTDNVVFGEKYYPYSHNECVCASCSDNEEVKPYLPDIVRGMIGHA